MMIVSTVIFFHLFLANIQFHCSSALIFKQSTYQQHKKRTSATLTATTEGKCHMNTLMAYLLWAFQPLFCSVHYPITFIFIAVGHLFSNNQRISITKNISAATETETIEGKCCCNPTMAYLQWVFPTLFSPVHYLLTFIFIVVRSLFF